MKYNPEIREILILKNITREGPGLLGKILAENSIKTRIIDLSLGEKPGPPEKYGAVVVLGGPDSANDENAKMRNELAFIRAVLAAEIPYLGICLGLQTLVKAAGGQVVKCALSEVGFRDLNGQFFKISLTDEGIKDPLFESMDNSLRVFQLHGETVILTDRMKLLAESVSCRNQIVRIGTNAYGIQCHFELTHEMLEKWISNDRDLLELDKVQLHADFREITETYLKTGTTILGNFLRTAGYLG